MGCSCSHSHPLENSSVNNDGSLAAVSPIMGLETSLVLFPVALPLHALYEVKKCPVIPGTYKKIS